MPPAPALAADREVTPALLPAGPGLAYHGYVDRLDPLLEEAVMAALALGALGAVIAGLYWLVTGISPWPGLVAGESVGFALGVGLLTLVSPRRSR